MNRQVESSQNLKQKKMARASYKLQNFKKKKNRKSVVGRRKLKEC